MQNIKKYKIYNKMKNLQYFAISLQYFAISLQYFAILCNTLQYFIYLSKYDYNYNIDI